VNNSNQLTFKEAEGVLTQLESVDAHQVQILASWLETAELADNAVFGALSELGIKKSTLVDIENLIGILAKDRVGIFRENKWKGLVAEARGDEKGFLD
jgi:hypothetical protein